MGQVKCVEDSLITSDFLKDCLPQILLVSFLQTLSQIFVRTRQVSYLLDVKKYADICEENLIEKLQNVFQALNKGSKDDSPLISYFRRVKLYTIFFHLNCAFTPNPQ